MQTGTKSNPLKVLIVGGGCAGPALAFWLARVGHRVTVVERYPTLRATGAQVDLRGRGIEAVRRMGLLDAVRSRRVHEPGVSFVDEEGQPFATIMANTSGKGAQTLTSDYEIMRGDLVRILYEATRPDVEYLFGRTVTTLEQGSGGVTARFDDGSRHDVDLLVGADGQGSRVRRAILPPDAADPYRRLSIHMAYWFVPRIASDRDIRDTYHATGGRMIMRRSHDPAVTQVYFILRETSAEASAIHDAPVERQQQFWGDRFGDAGWQAGRFIEGMATSDFFYSQEVVQVRLDTWVKDRVALIGDAACCPSPFSGMGTSGSLVGAYVLAGEIARGGDDLPRALAGYERVLRPYADAIQGAVKPRLLRAGLPATRFGVAMLRTITAAATTLRLPDLVARFSTGDRDGDWTLPRYEELEADVGRED